LIYVSIYSLIEFPRADFTKGYWNLTKYVEPLVLLGAIFLIYKVQKIRIPLNPFYLKFFLISTSLTFIIEVLIELIIHPFENNTEFFVTNPEYNLTLIPLQILGIFIAALFEEWIFRDYVVIHFTKALKDNTLLIILASSILFGLFHFQYYNDFSTLISIFLFGVLYVILYLDYKTFWVPLGVHFGHNLFAYLLSGNAINLTSNNSMLYGNYRPIFTIVEIVLIIFITKKLCPTSYNSKWRAFW